MPPDPFELEIPAAGSADVYLAHCEESRISWELVRLLDQAAIRVIGDLPEPDEDGARARRIMSGCAGVVGILAHRPESGTTPTRPLAALRHGAALGLPLALFVEKGVPIDVDEGQDGIRLWVGDDDPLVVRPDQLHGPIVYLEADDELKPGDLGITTRFERDVERVRTLRSYAFLIGRLVQDFAHAREAIRAAVERESGLPCLWSDDGRHLTNVTSVRERTRSLIEHASFVVADLTLGFENPSAENPSRAHEIGMAIAYERPIMLCSQEPRRYPYFSVGDMQMTFWATEAELERSVSEWIRTRREHLGRQVFNHRLATVHPGYEPRVGRPAFAFDPARRYVGPATPVPSPVRPFPAALLIVLWVILAVLALLIVAIVSGSR